jgi:hypothetical protein
MARKRDYKAEYARRIARGKALGLSRSQARGHPRKGEPSASSAKSKPKSDAKIEAAIRDMRSGASMTNAAKAQSISAKRLRKFLKAYRLARYQGNQWRFSDKRLRRVPIIANAQTKAITVKGFDDASRVGKFHNAVGQFIRNPDPIILKPFEGKGVTDANGQFHLFETDPNALIRYALKDEPEFHEIYQIIQN